MEHDHTYSKKSDIKSDRYTYDSSIYNALTEEQFEKLLDKFLYYKNNSVPIDRYPHCIAYINMINAQHLVTRGYGTVQIITV